VSDIITVIPMFFAFLMLPPFMAVTVLLAGPCKALARLDVLSRREQRSVIC
jgi:hypothetical protein